MQPPVKTRKRIVNKNKGIGIKSKTKSASKKRFSLTATGLIRARGAKHRHNMGKYSSRQRRTQRGSVVLAINVGRVIKKYHNLTN